MKKGFSKVLLASTFALMAIVPAMANNTTLGFNATVDSVISLQLEKIDGTIVSGDDLDPGSFTGANEVLSFGTVTPLGTGTAAALTATRGTTGTIQSFVIDNARKLYTPTSVAANGLPKGNNNGAIYIVSGALQLRALRNTDGGGTPTGAGTTSIDVDNTSSSNIPVLVAPGTQTFAAGTTLDASTLILAPSATFTPFASAVAHDTALPITVGIHVPFTTTPGAKTATLTFRAT